MKILRFPTASLAIMLFVLTGIPWLVAAQSANGVSALERTHWTLTQLGDAVISPDAQQKEAFLTLEPANHRVSGSGGCNALLGSYELNGDQLKFGHMAGTMMACAKGMDTERAFHQMLEQVMAWKITGQTLELTDRSGKVLARFEARSTP